MNLLLKEIRRNPLLWLLVFVPVVFAGERLAPDAHTLLFVLSVLAIVPLAALLSHATESVAAKTGDSVGGLLNATLGNLTELVIAITALRAGAHHDGLRCGLVTGFQRRRERKLFRANSVSVPDVTASATPGQIARIRRLGLIVTTIPVYMIWKNGALLTRDMPDAVINTAAFHNVDLCESQPEPAYRTNTLAVRDMAKACEAARTLFFQIGTDYVVGGGGNATVGLPANQPIPESTPVHPNSIYALTPFGGDCMTLAHAPTVGYVAAASTATRLPARVLGERRRRHVEVRPTHATTEALLLCAHWSLTRYCVQRISPVRPQP